MNTMQLIKERFDQSAKPGSALEPLRRNAFNAFNAMGIPTLNHEEWKYTRISTLFNKSYHLSEPSSIAEAEIDPLRLPGHEQANELVFVNGIFSYELSNIRSQFFIVMPLEKAAENEYADIVSK